MSRVELLMTILTAAAVFIAGMKFGDWRFRRKMIDQIMGTRVEHGVPITVLEPIEPIDPTTVKKGQN